MATYAYCHRCNRHHKRGTKIFSEHKESLGVYISHLPRTPSHIKEFLNKKYR